MDYENVHHFYMMIQVFLAVLDNSPMKFWILIYKEMIERKHALVCWNSLLFW